MKQIIISVSLLFPGCILCSQVYRQDLGCPTDGHYFAIDRNSDFYGSNWVVGSAAEYFYYKAGIGISFNDEGNNLFVSNDPTNLFHSSDGRATWLDVVNGLGLGPSASMQYNYAANNGEIYVSMLGPNSAYELYKYGLGSGIYETGTSPIWSIVPNPVVNDLHLVEYSMDAGIIIIYDQWGKTVITQAVSGKDISVSAETLPAGLYLCV